MTPESSMDDIAKEWIKQYKENNMAALKDLINFLIRVSLNVYTSSLK